MTSIKEIRRQAAKMGIHGVEHMDRRGLVRAIQMKEGHTPCFDTDWCKPEWREYCLWKDECNADDYFQD